MLADCAFEGQLVEFLTKPGLAPGCVVLVNHALVGSPIEGADRVTNGHCCCLGITLLNEFLGAADARPRCRHVYTIPLSAPLGNMYPLLR